MVVEENSDVLRFPDLPWHYAFDVEGDHFRIHQFPRHGLTFGETVEWVLREIRFSVRAFCLDDLGHCFNPDEEGVILFRKRNLLSNH